MLHLMQSKVGKYFMGRKLMILHSPFIKRTGNSRVSSVCHTDISGIEDFECGLNSGKK